MVGTEYRIVTALDRAKEIWKGDAFCVHMTHREDHTLWLGEYSKLPSKDILWKSKPQKEEVKC